MVDYNGDPRPGNSPANVPYAGDVILNPSARFFAELGGTTPGTQYDQVISTGAFSLAGALNVSLTNGFTPSAGQSFNLFDWGTVSGSFSTLSLPTLSILNMHVDVDEMISLYDHANQRWARRRNTALS